MKWISSVLGEAISAAQSTGLVVDPRIYITNSSPPTPPTPPVTAVGYDDSDKGSVSMDSPVTEKDVKMSLPSYSALRILNGRPSVRRILQEEISASSGPVSVDGEPLTVAEYTRTNIYLLQCLVRLASRKLSQAPSPRT